MSQAGTSEDVRDLCPHCSVANCAFEMVCHCCAGRLPEVIQHSQPGIFGKIDVDELRMVSYSMAVAPCALAVWARKAPLFASVVALMLYLATAVPEAIAGHGLIGRGLISKGVMVLILGWAIMSGLYHNMMTR